MDEEEADRADEEEEEADGAEEEEEEDETEDELDFAASAAASSSACCLRIADSDSLGAFLSPSSAARLAIGARFPDAKTKVRQFFVSSSIASAAVKT